MSFNGSGVFVVNSTGQPVVASTLIEASVFNAFTADVATGLSTCVLKDGSQTITANIPMGGFKFTGLAAGTANGQSVRYEQLTALTPSIFSTGDVKLTLKTVADSGWVLMNDGSIGSASSGATTRANADTVDLYTLLWTNVADAQCPVSGGRGGSAAADFAANKTLTLPLTLGRALAVYGSGSGLTARALGLATGAETVVLVEANLAAHTHTGPSHTHTGTTSSNGAHTHTIAGAENVAVGTNGAQTPNVGGNLVTTSSDGAHTHNFTTDAAGTGATSSVGSGTAHANMQPTSFLNVMIKL